MYTKYVVGFEVMLFLCAGLDFIYFISEAVIKYDFYLVGDTLKIPDSVMGLTFLAAGMSVPEAVSSMIVTNQGKP